jgi:PAS domain-containing protein
MAHAEVSVDEDRRSRDELIAEIRGLRTRLAHYERFEEEELVRVRPLLEEVPAYLWSADHDLRLMWSRPSHAVIFGLDAEPDLGTTVYALFGSNADHPAIQAHRAALEGESRNFQVWVEVRGQARLLRATSSHYATRASDPDVVGVALDLTERVRMEETASATSRSSGRRSTAGRCLRADRSAHIAMRCATTMYWNQLDVLCEH